MKPAPRILVVEDDAVVGDLFRELLPPQGHEVDVVADAEKALTHLTAEAYDLVVCDKNLPGMSGIELLQRIKGEHPDLDVIIMTAYADMDSVLAAIAAGVYDYIVKPFDSIDDVVAKVDRALEKRRILVENRRLIDYLTQANAQIEAMNKSLEEKVAERTRQLLEANERLAELSMTDDVTGLYNQRFLFERLEEEYRRARRHHEHLTVMMIDIDHFKGVNDHHDHLFGSRVLKRLGGVLREGVRSVDFVVRYGGDEFAIILPHTRLVDAVPVAERLRATVEEADFGEGAESCHITMSIGIAAIDATDGESARALLRAADKAMYVAKAGGRNCVAVMDAGRTRTVVAGIR